MSSITPRVDIAFKKIFGTLENKDLLISLINSIVSEEDQVADLTLLNPYNPQNFKNDKLSILDIKAQGFDGKLFNIEVQISDEADYDKRALYYWAKIYTEQLKQSEDYGTLSKAIGIHILNFLSIPESKKYHNAFHITEKDSGLVYFKDLELHTIELTKWNNTPNQDLSDIVAKVKTSLDMWVAFLTKHELLDPNNLPKEFSDPSLKKALDVLEVMNLNQEERELYEGQRKWFMIEANTLKKMKEDGREEGKIEGKIEGLAEGEKRGKIEVATALLKSGVSVDIISLSTGLSREEIKKLRE